MSDVRPNLFIVGAMKSGTSSLHAYLGTHPDVYMCEPKEPGYFCPEVGMSNGEPWYLDLFKAGAGKRVVGESSTHYTKLPQYQGVIERIADFSPDARFIYLMRDPVERSISHYWHMVRWHGESRSLLDALRSDSQFRDFSYYAMQLRPYLDRFGSDRVLVQTFEAFSADAAGVTASVFRWLGVDDTFVPPNAGARENETPPTVVRARGRGMLHRLRYSRAWNRLGPLVPQSVRRLGVALAEKPVARAAEPRQEAIAYLREVQGCQVDELSDLIGRRFPEWRTLHGR